MRRLPGTLLCAAIAAVLLEGTSHAELYTIISCMEGYRKEVPIPKPADGIANRFIDRGITITSSNGEAFTVVRLCYAAKLVPIDQKQDMFAMLCFLNDRNPVVRYIAIRVMHDHSVLKMGSKEDGPIVKLLLAEFTDHPADDELRARAISTVIERVANYARQ